MPKGLLEGLINDIKWKWSRCKNVNELRCWQVSFDTRYVRWVWVSISVSHHHSSCSSITYYVTWCWWGQRPTNDGQSHDHTFIIIITALFRKQHEKYENPWFNMHNLSIPTGCDVVRRKGWLETTMVRARNCNDHNNKV